MNSNDERLDPKIEQLLAQEDPSPEFPRDQIRDRVRASVARRQAAPSAPSAGRNWWKAAASVAAALVIFVAGVEYGRGIAPAAVPEVDTASQSLLARSVSLSIQTHGSRYVAEMARLAETTDSMSPEERQQAREVALAVLFGAAAELLKAAPEDDDAASVARSLLVHRQVANADGSLRLY